MSVSECNWLSKLKSVLINASDYSSGKDQSATNSNTNAHTHMQSGVSGTEIDAEALQKSNEEEDIGERNVLLA